MPPIHNSDLSSYKSRPLDRDVVSLPDQIANSDPSTISRRCSQEGADSLGLLTAEVGGANKLVTANLCDAAECIQASDAWNVSFNSVPFEEFTSRIAKWTFI